MRSGALVLAIAAAGAGAVVAVACGEDNLGIVRPELDASIFDGASSSSGSSSGGSSGSVAPSYTVAGAVTGLAASKSIVLTLGNGNDVTVSSNTSFTFPVGVVAGQMYAVTVKTQPNLQKCAVGNGTGTMTTAGVTNVTVDCIDSCGDGVADTASGEGCDDDNTNDVDACSNLCSRNPLSLGGNEKTFIENALVQMMEPFTAVAVDAGPSSWGAAPSSGVFITSNDNNDLVFPTNWQTFLDAGGNILVIGGSNSAEYRTFIGAFVTLDATASWHASDDCTSDWNKVGSHPASATLPAAFEFPNPSTGFHMTHFPTAGQPANTVLLGETCHAAGNDAIYALRTYPSGGTFAYLAFNVGKFLGTGTTGGFTIPFLQSYLAYVRSKK